MFQIQCASGGRASAVMLIQMGKELGLSAEKCVTLGNTLQLPCMAKQPLVNWISEYHFYVDNCEALSVPQFI